MTLLLGFNGTMTKYKWKVVLILLLGLFSSACVKLALQFSPSLISNFTKSLFEECDPELAKHSLPADLKLMEGLLKNDPSNSQLLTSLCMGFAGYAMLFVEEEDPERASRLYLRARKYGLLAIGDNSSALEQSGTDMETVRKKLSKLGKEALDALFWSALSWNAWINLNLDKPAALSQLGIAQAFLDRVLETNPEYLYGSPYVLMGSMLAARPEFLGGSPARAKDCFEKAMYLSHRKFFLVHYYFAKYYAVRIQDRNLFLTLFREVDATSPCELKEVCLINAVMKQKAKCLIEKSEEMFF
jgi:tetratricopeptide (TPR) repeat protein